MGPRYFAPLLSLPPAKRKSLKGLALVGLLAVAAFFLSPRKDLLRERGEMEWSVCVV